MKLHTLVLAVLALMPAAAMAFPDDPLLLRFDSDGGACTDTGDHVVFDMKTNLVDAAFGGQDVTSGEFLVFQATFYKNDVITYEVVHRESREESTWVVDFDSGEIRHVVSENVLEGRPQRTETARLRPCS